MKKKKILISAYACEPNKGSEPEVGWQWALTLSKLGNQVYVINEDGKLISLDKDSAEIYWITDLSKFRIGQKAENLNLWLGPYLINNLIYNISYFGEIKVVSPITGEILSTEKTGVKGALVPPIIVSEYIFLTDESSNVYKFK